MRFALDTNVALYAVGGPSPFQGSGQLVRLLSAGTVVGEASIELVQEYLHVRARRLGDCAAAEAQDWLELLTCHPVERDDVEHAARLFRSVPSLDALDAVHAATCLNRGIPSDRLRRRELRRGGRLRRVDPREVQSVLFTE